MTNDEEGPLALRPTLTDGLLFSRYVNVIGLTNRSLRRIWATRAGMQGNAIGSIRFPLGNRRTGHVTTHLSPPAKIPTPACTTTPKGSYFSRRNGDEPKENNNVITGVQ